MKYRRLLYAVPVLLIAAWALLRVLSMSAASIFNYAMERQ